MRTHAPAGLRVESQGFRNIRRGLPSLDRSPGGFVLDGCHGLTGAVHILRGGEGSDIVARRSTKIRTRQVCHSPKVGPCETADNFPRRWNSRR